MIKINAIYSKIKSEIIIQKIKPGTRKAIETTFGEKYLFVFLFLVNNS